MTRTKVFVLLVLAFVLAMFVEDSRAVILDFASPAMQPAYRWMATQEMKQISGDLETHYVSQGSLPFARGEFEGWLRDRYRDDRYHTDSWGTPYRLRVEGNSYQVISAGTDGEFGTDDDLVVEGSVGGPPRSR